MKPGSKAWTVKYTLLNATYFIAFCTVHAYAAVFLLAHGFSNTEVGILLAVANIVSAIAQPLVASLIDKPGPITNRGFVAFSVLVILLGSVLLMFIESNKVLIFVIFCEFLIQLGVEKTDILLIVEDFRRAGLAGGFYDVRNSVANEFVVYCFFHCFTKEFRLPRLPIADVT